MRSRGHLQCDPSWATSKVSKAAGKEDSVSSVRQGLQVSLACALQSLCLHLASPLCFSVSPLLFQEHLPLDLGPTLMQYDLI